MLLVAGQPSVPYGGRGSLLVFSGPADSGRVAGNRPGGPVFLGIASVLFLAGPFIAVGYLKAEQTGRKKDFIRRCVFC
jgi:hypothetical protein